MLDGPTFQLLAIVVLPIVIGFVWMFASAIFQFTEGAHSGAGLPRENFCGVFRLFSIADAFDPERAILWEAQIPALERIGSGISVPRFFESYSGSLRLYPELFEGTSLTAWLQFLRESALVEVAGSEVRLTEEGRVFLSVLNSRYSASRHNS